MTRRFCAEEMFCWLHSIKELIVQGEWTDFRLDSRHKRWWDISFDDVWQLLSRYGKMIRVILYTDCIDWELRSDNIVFSSAFMQRIWDNSKIRMSGAAVVDSTTTQEQEMETEVIMICWKKHSTRRRAVRSYGPKQWRRRTVQKRVMCTSHFFCCALSSIKDVLRKCCRFYDRVAK